MAKTTESRPQGQHIDIPKVSSISGRVAMHSDAGRTLWKTGGSLIVFLMALSVVILPLALVFTLLRQPQTGPNGLAWLWITMLVVTGLLAFMAAYGIVRSVLEADS